MVRDTHRRFDGHPTREFVPITGDQPAGGAPSREEPECHVATVVDLPAEGLTVAEVLTHYPQLAARTSAGVLRGRTGRTPDTDHAASTR